MATEIEFPLLPGTQEHYQDSSYRYPLSFTFADGSYAPLFTRGVVSSLNLKKVALTAVEQILARHAGQRVLVVQILEGARVFARMLAPHLERLCPQAGIEYEMGAVQVRSYSHGSHATGHQIIKPLQDGHGQKLTDCRKYDAVVLVDDLIDAGDTMAWLISEYLPDFMAKEIGICTMLDKDRKRTKTVEAILCSHLISAGKSVPNDWLVGYGLDLALPGWGQTPTLHLFRQALPGGIYAFNSAIEDRLTREYQQRPAVVAEQLSIYISKE